MGVALACSIGLQAINWDFGRRDNGDWARFAPSFARSPVGFRAAGAPGDEPVYRAREVLDFLPLWVRKSPAEPPYSRLETGSSFPLWIGGWLINGVVHREPVLDLRLLGIPSRLLLTGGLAFLVFVLARSAPQGRRWRFALPLVAVALAAVHCDLGVISYANSFFRETAGQAGLAWTLGLLALPDEELLRRRWWLAAAVLFTTTSAAVHLVLVVPLAVVLLLSPRAARRALLAVVAVAGIVGVAFATIAVPPRQARNVAFNALFYGVLPESRDPAGMLSRLGLPPESLALVGERVYTPEGRAFVDRHDRPRQSDVIAAILSEPGAFARLATGTAGLLAGQAGDFGIRSSRQGDCAEPTPLQAPRFQTWSRSGLVGPGALVCLLVVAVAGLAFVRSSGEWRRRLAVLTSFCALAAAAEFTAALVGDGRSGVERHLFLGRILFDQSVLFAILLAVTWRPGATIAAAMDRLRTRHAVRT